MNRASLTRHSLNRVLWPNTTPRKRHHRFNINIFSAKGVILSLGCRLRIAYFLKPYFFSQLSGFGYNILNSTMEDISVVLILSTFQQRKYFPKMQIYGSPVLDT